MRVLMLGWEFPPYISGGLGTACHGLTRAMSALGADVLFVLPQPIDPIGTLLSHRPAPAGTAASADPAKLIIRPIASRLAGPYVSPAANPGSPNATPARREPHAAPASTSIGGARIADYGGDLLGEVQRYAQACAELMCREPFDVIHAHDWMTFPAAQALAARSGKPLVAHVHSTEFDRAGQHAHSQICEIERQGLHAATAVICVSRMTQSLVAERYGVPESKLAVVYNGIDGVEPDGDDAVEPGEPAIRTGDRVVLFLGRLTMQKGPEYFVAAAKRVLQKLENVKFVVAGAGDLLGRVVGQAAALGIGHKVLFTGFLRGAEVDRAFEMADLYVMPSVSEPFGIAPLEAVRHGVPVLVSKNSGISEVLHHALKVDFWDVDEMANKILGVLRHPPLAATLRRHAAREIRDLTWHRAAAGCLDVYRRAVGPVQAKSA